MKKNHIKLNGIKANLTDAKNQSNRGWAGKLLVEAAILAVIATTICIKSCPSKPAIQIVQATAYSEARSNPGKRQQYLDKLKGRIPMPHNNTKIEYLGDYSERRKIAPSEVMSTLIKFPPKFDGDPEVMDKLPILVAVSSSAFNVAYTEDEFISMLADHEFIHIKLWSGRHELTLDRAALGEINRILSTEGDLFLTFSELEAYRMQIQLFSTRELSEDFKNGIVKFYRYHRKNVEMCEQTPLIKWILREYPEDPLAR